MFTLKPECIKDFLITKTFDICTSCPNFVVMSLMFITPMTFSSE